MQNSQLEVLLGCLECLQQGQKVTLVSVAKTWGTSPRPVGALLAVSSEGRFFGSVSGGCVEEDLIEQLKKGIIFSLPHKIEVELSEKMTKIIPNTEMVKFEKSGSNAVTGAVRAARAFTKREKIAYCGSGGVWHDWQAAMVSLDGGVPDFNRDLIKIFEYNDSDGLEQIFEDNSNEIAAVVLEPTVFTKPENNFLLVSNFCFKSSSE